MESTLGHSKMATFEMSGKNIKTYASR